MARVSNEREAFALLEELLRQEIDEHLVLEFDGWPVIKFRITGEEWDQTITPTAMRAFLDLQQAVDRTVATVKYGEANTRRLTKEDRQLYEIRVRVENGSSNFEVDIQSLLLKLIKEGVGNMSGTELVIVILGTGLLISATAIWRHHIDSRRKERAEVAREETMRETLETMQVMTKQDTQRWAVMERALRHNPELELVEDATHDMKNQMLKTMANSERAEFDGEGLDPGVAEELAINTRRRSEENRLDGVYRIEKVDSSDPVNFKVTIRQVDGQRRFVAIVQDDLGRENKRRIEAAEWGRHPVRLQVNARMVGGEVRQATVLSAEDV